MRQELILIKVQRPVNVLFFGNSNSTRGNKQPVFGA